jgi:dUTP pyrophosphatase
MSNSHLRSTDPAALTPTRATAGSWGYDLRCADAMTIPPGVPTLVPTGLWLDQDARLPSEETCGLLLLPRSSLALRHRLIVANSPGLIDDDYSGEIKVLVLNLGTEPVALQRHERIAQLVYVHLARPRLTVRDTPGIPDTGRGGFGSTGVL